jgi:hypothetical protein
MSGLDLERLVLSGGPLGYVPLPPLSVLAGWAVMNVADL